MTNVAYLKFHLLSKAITFVSLSDGAFGDISDQGFDGRQGVVGGAGGARKSSGDDLGDDGVNAPGDVADDGTDDVGQLALGTQPHFATADDVAVARGIIGQNPLHQIFGVSDLYQQVHVAADARDRVDQDAFADGDDLVLVGGHASRDVLSKLRQRN